MSHWLILYIICFVLGAMIVGESVAAVPPGFVYLSQVDSSIVEDIRYSGHDNFIHRKLPGYKSKACILKRDIALALSRVQAMLVPSDLSLKVYDCYHSPRVTRSINRWLHTRSTTRKDTKMQFYPRIRKSALWSLGYLQEKSEHSQGNSVDVTIVPLPLSTHSIYHRSKSPESCIANYRTRNWDGGVDMGSNYDCFDRNSAPFRMGESLVPYENRRFLRHVMEKAGFVESRTMWWHFVWKQPRWSLSSLPQPKYTQDNVNHSGVEPRFLVQHTGRRHFTSLLPAPLSTQYSYRFKA